MCGIFGIVRFDGRPVELSCFEKMWASLAHRGPDDYGDYISGSVGLANLRLSIIDIESGHQPMFSDDKKICVVQNGEIYNFMELKKRLENRRFKTRCDTESILRAYEEWGAACLSELNGMFTLAIWDGFKNEMIIARDRMGIKPLYYTFNNSYFIFASEIKALINAGLVKPEVDIEAMQTYLELKYIPDERTMFKGVRRLLPGQWIRIPKDSNISYGNFWKYNLSPERKRPLDEYTEELRSLVSLSVKDHLVSGVPVGVFFSGGVDSGIVISEMAKHTGAGIKAFAVDYLSGKSEKNEVDYVAISAARAGAIHKIVNCPSDLAVSMLEKMIYHLDEPISEPLLAPSDLLSRAARDDVKVVLTGEGSDELFSGYSRYKMSYYLNLIKHIPRKIKATAAFLSEKLCGSQHIITRIFKISIDEKKVIEWYMVFTSDETTRLTASTDKTRWRNDWMNILNGKSLLDFLLETDACFRMPEYILTRTDKLSMASSLEIRVPLFSN